ncbi:MAG TPA: malto-oligosyltrehalose synthase [Chthoniobacteraceae bacterium]|nr:malto-oligosyltrehalose synthase [Chthoniobacteraceae bacterium]
MKSTAIIPAATYRLQFNKDFTFAQARGLVPYLRALGISHVYASPYFKAGPRSTHGYDICDHNELNPEVGSRADYDALVEELHRHGMRQIVDFVPNHMGIGTAANAWWMDVLENGPASQFASYFDIDWRPPKSDLENKVLLPILGDQYGRVLERGEFALEFEKGAFFLRYFEAKLPLAPRSYEKLLKPALEKLKATGTPEMQVAELLSIMTSMAHLPERTDIEPEKIIERTREIEIIKRRIARLCEECPPLPEAIAEVMHAISGTPGSPRSFDALDELLNMQAYRLSFWRVASEEINYRRFFDINELAAIRMELPEVFEATHRLIFELVAKGALDGLRIDHVDGLWLPRDYLEKLQQHAAKALGAAEGSNPLYLLVEKILLGDERLREDWPVHGTTGYDFVDDVTGLFVDGAAEKTFTETYDRFIADETHFDEIAYQSKQLVMRLSLAGEINMLAHMLDRLSEKNRWYRDFTLNALTQAVREVMACFPVYRAYVEPDAEPSPADREAVLRAVRLAKRRNPGIERSIFNFIGEILLKKFPENIDDVARGEHMRFVMKLQQCAGPVMAKGVEDTAFYIYHRLAALNEVGGEPGRFGLAPGAFFERCATRAKDHPHALLATATHDTKRGEDTRARLAAISEFPSQWRKSVRRWQVRNRRLKREIEGEWAPAANEEYLLYQTLLGTWPLEPFESLRPESRAAYTRRIQDYMIKALKEAKVNTSWIQPNEDWEEAVRNFTAEVLKEGSRFLKDFEPFAAQVAEAGMVNSLAQLVLKCTLPGVPDFYQGCELWDFSLVDPDNRRPVDYALREGLLASLENEGAVTLFKQWRDGRIKLLLTRALLHFRGAHPELFTKGEFVPLQANGAFAENCVAFLRRAEGEAALVVVPRLSRKVGVPPIGAAWRDTKIELPEGHGITRVRELFTNAEFDTGGGVLAVAEALKELPAAVFTSARP